MDITEDPVGTLLLFENARVRVWELTLGPEESCVPHRHLHDYLMLYPDPALIRRHSDTSTQALRSGFVAFAGVGRLGLPPHQITNVGEATSTHYVVELLGPSASDTSRPLEHNGRAHLLRTRADPT